MARSVAIVDIGSSSITALIGERGINNTFRILGKGVSDYAGFENGQFIEPETVKMAVGLAIANAESSSGMKITEAFVGVPGEFSTVICKECSLTFAKQKKITQKEVDQLYFTNNNFKYPTHTVINNSPIYFTLEDGRRVIDPVGNYATRLNALVSYVLAENNFLDFMENIFSEIGVRQTYYVSACLAECLHMFEPQIRDRYVLLVDCGYITTNVMLSRGDGLLFLSNFSMGGGYITADLSSCLKIGFSVAENLKHKAVISWEAGKDDTYDVANKDVIESFAAKDTNQIIRDRIDLIAKYIEKSLANCVYDFPEYIPLYITGGGLNYIKGIKDYLTKRLGRRVELVKPNIPHISRPDTSSEIGLLDVCIDITDGYLNILAIN
ncbi:MAG: hypothetical protein K6F08_03290 [bacterium]|nr:hypothetical protein [bacterium]